MRRGGTAVLAALAAVVSLAACPVAAQLSGEALFETLRKGGHVVFIRHTRADVGVDQDQQGLGPCAEQRALSLAGRIDALAIGDGFRRHRVPVERVVSSPYCRAIETGILMFGLVEVDHDLRQWHGHLPPPLKDGLPARVAALIATPPAPGTNTVVVAHKYDDVLGVSLDQGEAVVIRPTNGKVAVVGRLRPGDWGAQPGHAPRMAVIAYPVAPGPRAALVAEGAGEVAWFADGVSAVVGRLDVALGRVRPVGLPDGIVPRALAAAPDGTLWVAAGTAGVARVTQDGAEAAAVPVDGLAPDGIALAPDGGVWLAAGSTFARLDPERGTLARFPAPARIAGRTLVADGRRLHAVADGHLVTMDTATGDAVLRVLPAAGVPVVAPDGAGTVWLGYADRLVRLDLAGGVPGARDRPDTPYPGVAAAHELCIAAGAALHCFDDPLGRFEPVRLPEGGPVTRLVAGRERIWAVQGGAFLTLIRPR